MAHTDMPSAQVAELPPEAAGEALIGALAHIIWSARMGRLANVVVCKRPTLPSLRESAGEFICTECKSADDVAAAVRAGIGAFMRAPGVAMLLYSLLLTRAGEVHQLGATAGNYMPAAEWVRVVRVRERSRHGQEHQAKQAAIKACRPTAVSAGAGPVCSPLLTSCRPLMMELFLGSRYSAWEWLPRWAELRRQRRRVGRWCWCWFWAACAGP